MPRNPLGIEKPINEYLDQHSPQHPVLDELARITSPLALSAMQISPSQGAFLSWLVKLLGAQRTIEVGVFTGYSALVTALALPKNGKVLACDVNEEWTNIARQHWKKAEVDEKIELILAPAEQTLRARLIGGEENSYDFAFIDADKENYSLYFELCLRLIRRGGVIVLDNMLWGGSVANKSKQSSSTRALRELNERLVQDKRVTCSLVPIGDGLMLATKN